jgi:phosphomannomutase
VQVGVAEAQPSSTGSGRVLLRKSGTEPLVRVMVEAPITIRPRRSPTAWPTWSSRSCR